MKHYIVEENPLSHLLFNNTKLAWFWLVVRLYVGYEWLSAGWEKLHDPTWTGAQAGTALGGFLNGAVAKTAGLHPDVQSWYAWFLEHAVMNHLGLWAHLVTYGECLVGVALIIGLFTGIAAFFGLFMNLNYLLAGTVSTNPVLFVLAIGILMAWKVAGFIGLDHWVLPRLGTPWQKFETGTVK